MGRMLRILRPKTIMGMLGHNYIMVDGKNYGNLPNGKEAYIDLDYQAHEVWIYAEYSDGKVRGESFFIPANNLDYYLIIEKKTGLTMAHISLVEDYSQAEKNRKILDEQRKIQDIKQKIDSIIMNELQKNMRDRDFTALRSLNAEYKQSAYYRESIIALKKAYYKEILEAMIKHPGNMSACMECMKPLEIIPELENDIKHTLRHYDYVVNRRNNINSVLSLNVEEDILKIDKNIPEVFEEGFEESLARVFKERENGNMEQAVNALLFADFPEEELDKLKRSILKGAMVEGKFEDASEYYQEMLAISKYIFSVSVKVNGEIVYGESVDKIIAEAIRYFHVGTLDNVNDDLKVFLEVVAPASGIDKKQYTILQTVFAWLKGYEQEKMVLDAMVKNMVERTPEQEDRLKFLCRNVSSNITNGGNFVDKVDITSATDKDMIMDGKLIYEYRCMTWKNNEIKNFFDTMSLENKTLQIPVVVSEWTKNIEARGIEWKPSEIKERVEEKLKKSLGEQFGVAVTNSSVSGARLDYSDSIAVIDISGKGYPWLAFLICGEETIVNHLMLSVYGLYMPDIDLSDALTIYERNAEIAKMVEMLKEKQNPKINNYIQTMTDLFVEELECWINDIRSTDIYS